MPTNEPLISGPELDARLALLAGWASDGAWITRDYGTDGWQTTMLVVGAIAFVAEAANHHPDLAVHWDRVTARLQTHSAGGITEKDLQLAERLEQTITWKPSGGFPGLEGQAGDWLRT